MDCGGVCWLLVRIHRGHSASSAGWYSIQGSHLLGLYVHRHHNHSRCFIHIKLLHHLGRPDNALPPHWNRCCPPNFNLKTATYSRQSRRNNLFNIIHHSRPRRLILLSLSRRANALLSNNFLCIRIFLRVISLRSRSTRHNRNAPSRIHKVCPRSKTMVSRICERVDWYWITCNVSLECRILDVGYRDE